MPFEERAGLPALAEKQSDACEDWCAAERRLFDTRANTPAGMILKLTIEWTDGRRRDWRTKGRAADLEFHPDAIPSVLLHIERLAGTAV